jgi:hypothetical protein
MRNARAHRSEADMLFGPDICLNPTMAPIAGYLTNVVKIELARATNAP